MHHHHRSGDRGQFVGVNEQKYPHDLTSSIRHYTQLKKLHGRYSIPEPLRLDQLDAFLAQVGVSEARARSARYPVRWLEVPTTSLTP